MAVEIDFCGNITTGKTIVSKDNPAPVSVSVTANGTWRFKVKLVKAAATGLGRVSVIPATGLSCQISISTTRGGTSLTSATASEPADINDVWTVDLPCGTEPMVTASTAGGTSAWLEALIGDQNFAFEIRIFKPSLTGAVQDPEPIDTALGEKKASALYVPKNGDAGFQFFMRDIETNQQFRIVIQNGELQCHPIS